MQIRKQSKNKGDLILSLHDEAMELAQKHNISVGQYITSIAVFLLQAMLRLKLIKANYRKDDLDVDLELSASALHCDVKNITVIGDVHPKFAIDLNNLFRSAKMSDVYATTARSIIASMIASDLQVWKGIDNQGVVLTLRINSISEKVVEMFSERVIH